MVESSEPAAAKNPMLDRANFKHQLTSTLPVSKDSFIVIELADPVRSYKAGETIQGIVRIVVNGYFNASSVTLRLYGVE